MSIKDQLENLADKLDATLHLLDQHDQQLDMLKEALEETQSWREIGDREQAGIWFKQMCALIAKLEVDSLRDDISAAKEILE